MRYLMSVMSSPETESADYDVPAEAYEAMAEYNEELVKAGVLLSGEGLAPTAEGAEIVFRDGEVSITDGPFTEAKEFVAGYWVLQVSSREEALEWAKRVPHPPAGSGVEMKLQLRRIGEPEDMEQMPEDLKKRERELRDQGY